MPVTEESEFADMIPLMRRLYERIKPLSPDETGYLGLSVRMHSSQDGPQFVAIFNSMFFAHGSSADELLAAVRAIDPKKVITKRITELKSAITTLEARLCR